MMTKRTIEKEITKLRNLGFSTNDKEISTLAMEAAHALQWVLGEMRYSSSRELLSKAKAKRDA